jgi:hypothetical protein
MEKELEEVNSFSLPNSKLIGLQCAPRYIVKISI